MLNEMFKYLTLYNFIIIDSIGRVKNMKKRIFAITAVFLMVFMSSTMLFASAEGPARLELTLKGRYVDSSATTHELALYPVSVKVLRSGYAPVSGFTSSNGLFIGRVMRPTLFDGNKGEITYTIITETLRLPELGVTFKGFRENVTFGIGEFKKSIEKEIVGTKIKSRDFGGRLATEYFDMFAKLLQKIPIFYQFIKIINNRVTIV